MDIPRFSLKISDEVGQIIKKIIDFVKYFLYIKTSTNHVDLVNVK